MPGQIWNLHGANLGHDTGSSLGLGSDADNVYAVTYGGVVLRCMAGSSTCTMLTSGTTQNLISVWGSDAGNVYVVGTSGAILRCAAGSSTCAVLTSGTTQTLGSVWGSDASNVYAVGEGGTALRCSAGTSGCTALTSGTTQFLSSVWGKRRQQRLCGGRWRHSAQMLGGDQ